jgi:hypothetical protein
MVLGFFLLRRTALLRQAWSGIYQHSVTELKSIHGEKGASVREGFFAYLADATALYFQLKTAFT